MMSSTYIFDEMSDGRTSAARGRSCSTTTTTVSESSTSTAALIFISCRTHQWSTPKQFKNLIKAYFEKLNNSKSGDSFFSFKGVDDAVFTALDATRDDGTLECTCRLDYDSSTKILIVRIPTGYHELGHAHLADVVRDRTRDIGCSQELLRTSAKTMVKRTQQERQSKEGDTTFRPKSRGIDEYPTLVIEAGYSESLSNLRADAAKWFNMSGGNVRIVLVCSIKVAQKEIRLKKWIPIESTERRSGQTWVPTQVQEIVITMRNQRDGGAFGEYVNLRRPTGKGHFYVQGAPLLIEFSQLLERPANPRNPLEKDMQFDAHELVQYCYDVLQG